MHDPSWQPSTLAVQNALNAARRVRVDGPAEVQLGDRTKLRLEEGQSYIPPAEGVRLLRAMGNRPGEEVLGVVVHDDRRQTWYLVLSAKDPLPRGRIGVDGWHRAPEMRSFRRF